MTLLMLVVFIVMVAAWAQYAARQSHVLVDWEQEERAFAASEAGLEYALFLLNSAGETPDDLNDDGYIAEQSVTDPVSGEEVGRYSLVFSGSGSSVTVASVAYAMNKPDRCQEIEALIDSFSGVVGGTQYYVRSFNHKIGTTCRLIPVPGVSLSFLGSTPVWEGDVPGEVTIDFRIQLSPASPVPVEVTLVTSDGTALDGQDYIGKSERVRFEIGETNKDVSIDIISDNINEAMFEDFIGTLQDSNATITTPVDTLQIRDDD